ncbi:MAG TPA: aromatic ring hydroxylase [Desulfobacteraceae bacterium]|nr:aromatic ring hydroxylase [Desulfobacteraceae bacterium]
MRTKQEYLDSLVKKHDNLYLDGQIISRDHESLKAAANVIGTTFDLAQDPALAKITTAKSHISGETVNRFTHIHQTPDDLHRKQDMTRMYCQKVSQCIGRCMGVDAMNAINCVSYEADRANKGQTKYHKNFLKWLERVQKEDLVGACAQTDVKGHRMKRPAEQDDPDQYLRVVEKNDKGIVVRGCKVHITFASVADEILVLPTRSLTKDEGDWAVAFAVEADHPDIKQVLSPHNLRPRGKDFKRGFDWGFVDSYVIFEDAFVPWERVFLCGETQHGGICALLFALFHRHSYSGCKPAVGDMLVGLATLAAEVNGIEKTPHVREKIAELITITELGYAAGFTASAKGEPKVYIPGVGKMDYGPGACIPDSIYANVGRCITGEAVFKEQQILCEIAGGMPATIPHEGDFLNPETSELLKKYVNRSDAMSVEEQIKFWMLFFDYTNSGASGAIAYGAMHGGGSPIMEQIAIYSQYDLEKRKDIVKTLAGMDVTSGTPGDHGV